MDIDEGFLEGASENDNHSIQDDIDDENGFDDGVKFQLEDELPDPNQKFLPLSALVSKIKRNKINLRPDYQRKFMWSKAKQSALIDSFMRNIPVCEVIFAVRKVNGKDHYTCIDGQQRLQTACLFMEGKVPVKSSGYNWWYKDDGASGRKKRILPREYRERVEEVQINTITYRDISTEMEVEMFKRVQNGVALTVSETQQATRTLRASFVREMVRTYVNFDSSLVKNLNLNTARGADFRQVILSSYFLGKWPSPFDHLRVPRTPDIDEYISVPEDFSKELKGNLKRALTSLTQIAEDSEYRKHILNVGNGKKKPAKFSPLDLVASVCLIAKYGREMTIGQTVESIRAMRLAAHRSCPTGGRFFNRETATPFFEFINALDPENVIDPFNPAPQKKALASPSKTSPKQAPTSKKRAHPHSPLFTDSEDEVDYYVTTKKTSKSTAKMPSSAKRQVKKEQALLTLMDLRTEVHEQQNDEG
ncbi:hypothetical protein DL96DRAFT_486410 [Flagelloscypha sp. PMI_526]|nr:hypothetical protein DL96DRAFT_486410 [Flagelloscypha sp. PMI_526]